MNKGILVVLMSMFFLPSILSALSITSVRASGTHGSYVGSLSQYELTVITATPPFSPITGIPFAINGTPQVTPYTGMLPEGSYTLEMPETHNGYLWYCWVEEGDSNRIKTVTLNRNTTLTAFYFALEIVDFYPCNRSGNFQNVFEKGSKIYFNLTIRTPTSAPKNLSILMCVYDVVNVPIGIESLNKTVLPNSYEYYMINITIPKWAYAGNGTAYINIFEEGIPIVIEETTNVVIIPECISEFPSFLTLPLFIIATLLIAIVYKRKHSV
jgi:hypothetical protein